MQDSSTNGAGAAAEAAAAAGHEGQHGVAGLVFGAGGRAAPDGVPDDMTLTDAARIGRGVEVPCRPRRRQVLRIFYHSVGVVAWAAARCARSIAIATAITMTAIVASNA
jgi:hypothetical protein